MPRGIYKHRKNNRFYVVRHNGLVQLDGEWVDAVFYQQVLHPKTPDAPLTMYARTREDFESSFESVTEEEFQQEMSNKGI